MFRKNDRIIVSKSGDNWFGWVGSIVGISGYDISVSIGGASRIFRAADISAVPVNVDADVECPMGKKWYVTIEFAGDLSDTVLSYGRQPNVTWGNGMVKVESDSDIHLFSMTDVRHVHINSH